MPGRRERLRLAEVNRWWLSQKRVGVVNACLSCSRRRSCCSGGVTGNLRSGARVEERVAASKYLHGCPAHRVAAGAPMSLLELTRRSWLVECSTRTAHTHGRRQRLGLCGPRAWMDRHALVRRGQGMRKDPLPLDQGRCKKNGACRQWLHMQSLGLDKAICICIERHVKLRLRYCDGVDGGCTICYL